MNRMTDKQLIDKLKGTSERETLMTISGARFYDLVRASNNKTLSHQVKRLIRRELYEREIRTLQGMMS